LINSSIDGAKVYGLCRLTPHDQQEVLSSARVVIASHGSGLANLIWCQPGTMVIELLRFPFIPAFSRIFSVMGLEHHVCALSIKIWTQKILFPN